jgi:hypothetical protein
MNITPTDWIQAISMVVLVLVTGFYAYRTYSISKATEKQTQETREQRLSEVRPYLLIRLASEAVQWDTIEENEKRPSEFPVTIRNVGKGPALNIWVALWHPQKTYSVIVKVISHLTKSGKLA